MLENVDTSFNKSNRNFRIYVYLHKQKRKYMTQEER